RAFVVLIVLGMKKGEALARERFFNKNDHTDRESAVRALLISPHPSVERLNRYMNEKKLNLDQSFPGWPGGLAGLRIQGPVDALSIPAQCGCFESEDRCRRFNSKTYSS